jgi:hypothetical protein
MTPRQSILEWINSITSEQFRDFNCLQNGIVLSEIVNHIAKRVKHRSGDLIDVSSLDRVRT